MKILLFSLLFLCILQSASAQITGKLINTNGEPVSLANISLLNSADSSLVRTSLSNNQGNYLLENITAGKYILHISSSGYKNFQSLPFELTAQQKQRDFGTQVMINDVKELQEVVVRSEKPFYQQKAEGITVNVENSILAKGSSALEVLERSPGVVINRRDNSIELNGKSGVKVMLNGKLMRMSEDQLLTLLSGISADDIATIELLTSPSAKYDAEGSAGLINIVLKKNKRLGTSGSISLTAGYGYREKATASFNLAHNTNKMNLYSSYTYSRNYTYSSMYVDSWQNMPFMGGDIHALGWDTTHILFSNHNITVGAEAKLNAKTNIGGSIIYTNNRTSGTQYTHLGYNVLPDSLLQFTGVNTGADRWNNAVSSMYVERIFKQEEKLNLSVDYLFFSNNDHYQVQSSFVNKHGMQAGGDENLSAPAQKGAAKTKIGVVVGKVDYAKPLSKSLKLETGIKGTYTQSSSFSGFESWIDSNWTSDPQTTNSILMKETIAAAYASLNTQINSSTNLVTGLRYENASTNMNDAKSGKEIIHRRLGSLFPNIFLTKKISDQNELQLSYTKRITRPSYNDLASYVGYNDPTAVYTGNPFLQPTITHNIKLGYNYKKYAFSLLYSRDKNPIARYQLLESPQHNMLYISPQNLSWQNNITFQTTLPFKIKDWWTMNWNFVGGLRQYKVEYTKQPFINSYFGYSLNYSQLFKLPHSFSAELSGGYNSDSYNGTQKVEGFNRLNFGIKKELKNNKGSFQFSISDILRRERYDIHYGTLTQEAFNIYNQVIVYTESSRFTIFKISYSRSFGNNKAETKRNAVSNDEQERIRKE